MSNTIPSPVDIPSPLDKDALEELQTLAVDTVRDAAETIASVRPSAIEHKEGGGSLASTIVTEMDRQVEEQIKKALAPSRAHYRLGLLAEETESDNSRHDCDFFWAVDPIDGTLAFVDDREGYAVSIALVSRGGVPLVGAICNPRTGEVVQAAHGCGTRIDGAPWQLPAPVPMAGSDMRLQAYLDQSFLEGGDSEQHRELLEAIAASGGLEGVDIHLGFGAVLNAVSVSRHPAALYLKLPKAPPGGGFIWDFAASACIARESGAVVSDTQGAPLDLNRRASSYLNHRGILFASNANLQRQVLCLLSRY